MKTSELKQLIRECVREVLNEAVAPVKKSTPKLKKCEFCDKKKPDVKPRIDPYADKMYDGDSTPLNVCNSCARERGL